MDKTVRTRPIGRLRAHRLAVKSARGNPFDGANLPAAGVGLWADQFELVAKGDIQSTFIGSSPLPWRAQTVLAPSR